MMTQQKGSLVHTLREELVILKKSLNEKKRILDELHTVEDRIHHLEKIKDQSFYRDSEQEKKQKQDLMQQLKEEKRQLDHDLDALDLPYEKLIKEKREKLTFAVLENFPEKKASLEETDQEISNHQKLLKELKEGKKQLIEIVDDLKYAVAAMKRAKTYPIFSFFFGKSPTIIAGERLESIVISSQKMQNMMKETTLHTLFPELLTLLKALEEKAKARWGFKEFKVYFTPLLEKLERKLDLIDEKIRWVDNEYRKSYNQQEELLQKDSEYE